MLVRGGFRDIEMEDAIRNALRRSAGAVTDEDRHFSEKDRMRAVLDVQLVLLQGTVGIVALLDAVISNREKG